MNLLKIYDTLFDINDVSAIKMITSDGDDYDISAFELQIRHTAHRFTINQFFSRVDLPYCAQCNESNLRLNYKAADIIAKMIKLGSYNPNISPYSNLLNFSCGMNDIKKNHTNSEFFKAFVDIRNTFNMDLSIQPLDFLYGRMNVKTNELLPMLYCKECKSERCKLKFRDVYSINSYVERINVKMDILMDAFNNGKVSNEMYSKFVISYQQYIEKLNLNLVK
jgi:hypothetical protein